MHDTVIWYFMRHKRRPLRSIPADCRDLHENARTLYFLPKRALIIFIPLNALTSMTIENRSIDFAVYQRTW